MSGLFNRTHLTSINGKEIIAVKDPVSGKIYNIEASLLLGQIFNLESLKDHCLEFEETIIENCQTGEETVAPLQIVDVLTAILKKLCENSENISYIQNNCCTDESNDSPIVDAGELQTIQLPLSSVNLEATAIDPDGIIVSYAWIKISGGSATIVSPNSASTQVTGLDEGSYVFQCIVEDDDGATSSDTVTIVVEKIVELNAPNANAGNDQNILLTGENTYRDSSVFGSTSSDSDGTIVTYDWSILSSPEGSQDSPELEIDSPNSANTVIKNLRKGTTVLQLQVTDNDNLTDTDTISITVEQPDVVNLTASANFDYAEDNDSESDSTPNGHVYPLSLTQITSMFTGTNALKSIKIKQVTPIGDLGLDNIIVSNEQIIPVSSIDSSLSFWARGLTSGYGNAEETNDDFTTTFIYQLIDVYDQIINLVTFTLNATNIKQNAPTYSGVLLVDDCNDQTGVNTLVDATGYSIGDTFTLQGTATPFNGGNNFYRLTAGGSNQSYDLSVDTLLISEGLFQINSQGEIIAEVDCN